MLSNIVRNQVKNQSKEDVDEIILDEWKGSELSQSEKVLLESFPNLQFLSMNNCGLRSLQNFPTLPKMIKLELNDNKITGGLDKLLGMKDMMQITLAGNQLRTLEDISPLIKGLKILDGTNKLGEEASLGEEEDLDEEDDEDDEEDERKALEGFIDDEIEGEEDSDELSADPAEASDDQSELEDSEPHKRQKS